MMPEQPKGSPENAFLQASLTPATSNCSLFGIAGPGFLYSHGSMKADPAIDPAADKLEPTAKPRRLRIVRRWLCAVGALLGAYLLAAYVIMPFAWRTDIRWHPDLSEGPRITHTASGL